MFLCLSIPEGGTVNLRLARLLYLCAFIQRCMYLLHGCSSDSEGKQCPLSLTATESGLYRRHCWSACFVLNLLLHVHGYGCFEIKLLNVLAVHVLSCVLSRPFSRCDSLSHSGDFVVVLLEKQTNVFVRTGYNWFERSLITWIIVDQLKMLTLKAQTGKLVFCKANFVFTLIKELVSFSFVLALCLKDFKLLIYA